MDEYSAGFCIRATRGGGGGGGGGTGTKCGRWNPTNEQVKVLTDLFRSGLRTPTTDQIQKISSQLSFYGKIESKNVFYWFQNHKARERQKRRRVFVDEANENITNMPLQHTTTWPSSTKHLGASDHEISSEVSEADERVIETLQLFPLNSLSSEVDYSEKLNKLLFADDDCKEKGSTFMYNIGMEMDHHPTLDLRLSFV